MAPPTRHTSGHLGGRGDREERGTHLAPRSIFPISHWGTREYNLNGRALALFALAAQVTLGTELPVRTKQCTRAAHVHGVLANTKHFSVWKILHLKEF